MEGGGTREKSRYTFRNTSDTVRSLCRLQEICNRRIERGKRRYKAKQHVWLSEFFRYMVRSLCT